MNSKFDILTSPADLTARRAELEAARQPEARVLVCATGCRALGALDVRAAFDEAVASAGLKDRVQVVAVGCHGLCAKAPVVLIEPGDLVCCGVKPKDAAEVVEKSVLKGEPIPRLCYNRDNTCARRDAIPFYAAQRTEVLAWCGRVDPTSLDAALVKGAYAAAAKALCEMSPEEVIEAVKRSGLRGRGGAGFPTGVKWEIARAAAGDEKYLVCNADEGDPGAFMDRALLEGDPHAVLEGMVIASRAIGAEKGFIYVRAEYPIAVAHAGVAVVQARERGLLGGRILGSDHSFDVEIRMGAGAFVCGEETALIASLEGERGMPRPRPPFPAQRGYLGRPTCINNVETFGNVPLIIRDGAERYAGVGTEKSKGTKIFALAGKVNNTGLVEAPMGATLRQIVFDIGGGIPGGKSFKAVQMGGPSGGCVPAEFLDLPIDYDSLKQVGAIMGSGGMIVLDEETCMVELARYFLEFTQNESCGKCTPCRVGTRQMLTILERMTNGQGRPGDVEELERLGKTVKATSLCGLGQTAPNPALSTIRYFREEYDAHVLRHECPAGVCRSLLHYVIDPEKCIGCELCVQACPTHGISGEHKEPHHIDQARCIHCGACRDACRSGAIRGVTKAEAEAFEARANILEPQRSGLGGENDPVNRSVGKRSQRKARGEHANP
jgi:NADH:ubiquinone oxidoreductase subunit F (NADH-binding)/formate hydrogenlyase subunit 6/NADH:ubiquinone oxidoreductase subunit I/(2Fe-2S) ferredoxin